MEDCGIASLRGEATSAPRGASLRMLYLPNNRLDDAAIAALAACPRLAGLEELLLGSNRVGDAGALALARAFALGSPVATAPQPRRQRRRAAH
jgi:hypothetical protein